MVMNEENKNKLFIGSIVAVITLIIVVVGATYAFFSLNVSGNTTNTNAIVETDDLNLISISGGTSNLHIRIKSDDMSEDKIDTSYYATDTDKDYLTEDEPHNFNIATFELTRDITEINNCTAELEVSIDGELKSVIEKEDTLLHVEGIDEVLDVDLAELKEEGSKVYPISITISDNNPSPIEGYISLTNREVDQSNLADKELNITITVKNLVCGGTKGKPAIEQILANSTSGTLDGTAELEERNEELTAEGVSAENLDTLRRFVGEWKDVTDNFICFGTSDLDTCLNNLDQYMYRIIGIDEANNQVKVIQATALIKETQYNFPWHLNYRTNSPWEESSVYVFLNSADSNYSYFVGNSYYNYMQNEMWTNLMVAHPIWYYGDNNTSVINAKTTYRSERREKLENGDPIGLMYASDYLYAGSQDENNWLYIRNSLNGIENTGSLSREVLKEKQSSYETTMTRYGDIDDHYYVRYITPRGIENTDVSFNNPIRAVFYLDGTKVILNGKGTIYKPYYITNVG